MAFTNALYDPYKESLLEGLLTVDVKVVLIDTSNYVYEPSHANLSDIPAAARVAISRNLKRKTITKGVFDANDMTFLSNAIAGKKFEAFAVFIDTGNEQTSSLMRYLDNYSITITGTEVTIIWDKNDGVFSL